MANLVERLRGDVQTEDCDCERCLLFREAADEIERLQKELDHEEGRVNDVMDAIHKDDQEIAQLRYELDMRVGVEIELAQLHARIEAAPVATIDPMGSLGFGVLITSQDLIGKRVRLVVEE